MIRRFFERLYHWMALLGLAMKDDATLEERDPDRQWGPESGGLMLSAKAKGPRLSVVIKNAGPTEIRENIPTWLFFYQLQISGDPPLTTFGEQALDPKRNDRMTDLILNPGQAIEAEIPVNSLYDLGPDPRRVTVTCQIAGQALTSNEVILNAPQSTPP